MSLALTAWRLGAGLVEPLAPQLLKRRASHGKEDLARLGERLGRPGRTRPDGPLVWLHGVSVGESLSLLPLVEALRTRRPDLNLLVTSGTVSSAQVLARRLPQAVIHQYAPVDGPRAVRRFLDHWRPGAAVFVESELWPNLITAANRRGVRLALLSARMTQASADRWRPLRGAARRLLSAFDLICPQDEATAERLGGLGAKIGPPLNLKLAAPAPPVNEIEAMALRAQGRPLLLAASTHQAEEALIARAAPAGALLAIAPRHPDRADAVAAELAASGRTVARRSRREPIGADVDTYLIDTLGELGAFYAAATVVVMGGSFAPGIGGHNPLEAARLGAAIVTGASVFNASDTYAEMVGEGAAIAVADEETLGKVLRLLLADPETARRIGEAALAYAERQGAALEIAVEHLLPLLPK